MGTEFRVFGGLARGLHDRMPQHVDALMRRNTSSVSTTLLTAFPRCLSGGNYIPPGTKRHHKGCRSLKEGYSGILRRLSKRAECVL